VTIALKGKKQFLACLPLLPLLHLLAIAVVTAAIAVAVAVAAVIVVAVAVAAVIVVAVVPVVVGNHHLIAEQRNNERHESCRIPSQTLAQG
jgi:hypothetical protein